MFNKKAYCENCQKDIYLDKKTATKNDLNWWQKCSCGNIFIFSASRWEKIKDNLFTSPYVQDLKKRQLDERRRKNTEILKQYRLKSKYEKFIKNNNNEDKKDND